MIEHGNSPFNALLWRIGDRLSQTKWTNWSRCFYLRYLLPNINDILDQRKIHFRARFHQIPHASRFQKIYRLLNLRQSFPLQLNAFRLKNAKFQRMMNQTFARLVGNLNDIIIFGSTTQEHNRNLYFDV